DENRELLSSYLRRFGFGTLTGIDLPGEQSDRLKSADEMKRINAATISYGQGISVTPIQLISAFQSIANDGVRMRPLIVKSLIDRDGATVLSYRPEKINRPVTPETARIMKDYLVNVVTEGTGKKAQVRGYIVAGKTGTAQIPLKTGGYDPYNCIASFVGFVPADDPRLVILVKIDAPQGEKHYGGQVAAPVFSKIASIALIHLGIPPDGDINNNKYGGI
ncbi:MAG: stage V sporulation protein D, partial [Candidatus Eremiobacteraeota bacterium]|nr:stage V sporulation protein D [Candidatus Eremiobacteraeota bacterium]